AHQVGWRGPRTVRGAQRQRGIAATRLGLCCRSRPSPDTITAGCPARLAGSVCPPRRCAYSAQAPDGCTAAGSTLMKYDGDVLRGGTLVIDDALVYLHDNGKNDWFMTERVGAVSTGELCRLVLEDGRSGDILIEDIDNTATNTVVHFTITGGLKFPTP